MADVFAVQQEIAGAIVGALDVRLLRGDGGRAGGLPTRDLAAYDLYLRGRHTWGELTPDRFDRSIQYFRAAAERDPQFAMAYVGLADAYWNMANYARMPRAEALSLARVAADRALQLDPNLAEAHASLGVILASRRDFAASEAAFRRAIQLNSNYASGQHYYSLLLMILGRLEEARERNRVALELDPLFLPANATRGIILCQMRDYVGARRELERAQSLAPRFPLTLVYLGMVYAKSQEYVEATAALERAVEGAPDFPGVKAALAHVYTRSGERRQTDAILRDLAARASDDRTRLNLALVHAVLGNTDAAFPMLETVEWDLPELIELRADPLLDPLRTDPRYPALLRRIGLSH
jgi:tetratricopeptide (TPR) repeat protein